MMGRGKMGWNKAVLALPWMFLQMSCCAFLGESGRLKNTIDGEDLITSACKHALHYEVCVSSLRSDPHSQTSDLKGLAQISLNLSLAHASETLSYVHELRSNHANTTSWYMWSCLSDCTEEYSEAIENLKDSAEALGDGDYDRVDTLVSAAMTDAQTCEDGFKDILEDDNDNVNNSSYPLTQRNCYFSDLCSNALAITKLLL